MVVSNLLNSAAYSVLNHALRARRALALAESAPRKMSTSWSLTSGVAIMASVWSISAGSSARVSAAIALIFCDGLAALR